MPDLRLRHLCHHKHKTEVIPAYAGMTAAKVSGCLRSVAQLRSSSSFVKVPAYQVM